MRPFFDPYRSPAGMHFYIRGLISYVSISFIYPSGIREIIRSGTEASCVLVCRTVPGHLCRSFLWGHFCVESLCCGWAACIRRHSSPDSFSFVGIRCCGFDLSILRTLRDLLLSQFFSGADASGGLCMFSWLCCACGVTAAFFRIGIQSCSAVVLVAQTGKRAGILSIRYTDLHSRWNGDFPCGSLDHFSVFSRYCKFLER